MVIADVSNVGSLLGTSSSLTAVVSISALFIIFNMSNSYAPEMMSSPTAEFYVFGGEIIIVVMT